MSRGRGADTCVCRVETHKKDRQVAIGLGVNWAIRLLLACAADYPSPVESQGHKDFALLATQVQAALASSN